MLPTHERPVPDRSKSMKPAAAVIECCAALTLSWAKAWAGANSNKESTNPRALIVMTTINAKVTPAVTNVGLAAPLGAYQRGEDAVFVAAAETLARGDV